MEQVKKENKEIFNIQSFYKLQESKINFVSQVIETQCGLCKDVYVSALETRLDYLRGEIVQVAEQKPGANQGEQVVQINDNPYENLGFPENMSYDKRSILRKECQRFIWYANLIDFMSVNSLTKIYYNSVNLFIDEVKKVSSIANPQILSDFEKNQNTGQIEGMF